MIDVLNHLSDNQVALLGCLGAAGASLLLLMMSYHGTGGSRAGQGSQPAVRRIPRPEERQSDRRAA